MAILNVTVTHEMFDAGAQVLRRYGLSGREEMIAAEVFGAMIKAHNLAQERADVNLRTLLTERRPIEDALVKWQRRWNAANWALYGAGADPMAIIRPLDQVIAERIAEEDRAALSPTTGAAQASQADEAKSAAEHEAEP